MNCSRPLPEAMLRAALNLRNAKTELSAREMQEIAHFACTAHDGLAFIREACECAAAQGAAINPESLLTFLSDNNLMLKELSNGQSETQQSAA